MKIQKGDWLYERLHHDPDQLARAIIVMERAMWNMARSEARSLLGQLEKQIRKQGGIRQWNEGLPIIRRVRERLREWVN